MIVPRFTIRASLVGSAAGLATAVCTDAGGNPVLFGTEAEAQATADRWTRGGASIIRYEVVPLMRGQARPEGVL